MESSIKLALMNKKLTPGQVTSVQFSDSSRKTAYVHYADFNGECNLFHSIVTGLTNLNVGKTKTFANLEILYEIDSQFHTDFAISVMPQISARST